MRKRLPITGPRRAMLAFTAALGAVTACAAGPAPGPAIGPGHDSAATHGVVAASAPMASAAHRPLKRPLDRRPLIDINAAPASELRTLPGIGPDDAARIVAARPYLSKTDLVTHQVVPAGVYLQIKYRIVAMQHGQPRVKPRG